MTQLSEHIKQAFEDFDASYHKLRAHLLHTLGIDEHQLAHDAETAAKPLVAEAEHDADSLLGQLAAGKTVTAGAAGPVSTGPVIITPVEPNTPTA